MGSFLAFAAWGGPSLDGTWQSRGWALMVEVDGARAQLFQYTDSSLLPMGELMLEDDAFELDARTILTFSRVGDGLRLSDGEGAVTIEFERIDALPPVTGFGADPLVNFDLLDELFEENFALFDLAGGDWDANTNAARAGVTAQTDDSALFDVFVDLLDPLRDRHTTLSGAGRFYQSGPPGDPFWSERREDILNLVATSQLDGGALMAAADDDRVRFGTIGGTVGYLLIEDFVAAAPGRPQLPATLDSVLAEIAEVEAMIVDLRFNPGGRGANGLALLDRLTDRERVAFVRETRSSLDEGFTPLESVPTRPAGNNIGGRPAVILVSGETASTADKVALAAAQMPWVTLVGMPTKGILSDALDLVLANGWNLSLSHQRTYSVAGGFFEQQGVAPDLQVSLGADDLDAGRDPMLDAALSHLASVPRPSGTNRPVDASSSGIWFDSGHSGEGWIIEVLPGGLAFVTWFSYRPDGGTQAWMTGVGVVDGSSIVLDEVLITSGARFGEAFDPDVLERTRWGRIEFHFESCDGGYVIYEGPSGFRAGVQRLERLAPIHGLDCDEAKGGGGGESAARLTGSWYDPQRSGEGWMLSVIDAAEAFVAWFTYDAEGNQAWLVGSGAIAGDVIEFDEMLLPIGATFGPSFDPASVERQPWGSLRLEFSDCNTVAVSYQTTLAAFESGQREAVRLTQPLGIACDG